jgi:general secretion pathway protein H
MATGGHRGAADHAIELSPEWIGVAWELRLSLEGRQLRLRDDGSGQLQVVQ